MDRHVASFSYVFTIGKELVHEVGKGEAALLEDTSLSVLAEYDIFGSQSRSRSNCDPLFACRDLKYSLSIRTLQEIPKSTYHVKAQPPLPLRIKHDEIHNAD